MKPEFHGCTRPSASSACSPRWRLRRSHFGRGSGFHRGKGRPTRPTVDGGFDSDRVGALTENRLSMRLILLLLTALSLAAAPARGEPVSLKGRTLTMLIGYPPGGGTDISGRLIASSLGSHLPGEPAIVVQNLPGADGLTAMNFFVQQVRPDGLTIAMGSGSEAEPTHYRTPQAHFDPTKFAFIGGAGRGGSALVIRRAAESRLYDKSKPPVIMGTTSGAPRSNMAMAAWGNEFLGWNLKWVAGYRGTNELFLALERGEVEMTATGNIAPIEKLLATGKFKILVQTGTRRNGKFNGREEFGDAP